MFPLRCIGMRPGVRPAAGMRSTSAPEQVKPVETGVKTTGGPEVATQPPQHSRRLDPPTAVLQMQTSVGNRVVSRLIENRVPQIGRDPAGGVVPAVASPGPMEVSPLSPSPSADVRGRAAAEPRVIGGAAGQTTPAAGGAAPGPGPGPTSPAAATAVTGAAASNAGVAPPAVSATPLPAPIAALPSLTAMTALGTTSVAAVAVSTLGNQLSVRAYDRAPKGPMPTGLPIGPEPMLPREPTIPEATTLLRSAIPSRRKRSRRPRREARLSSSSDGAPWSRPLPPTWALAPSRRRSHRVKFPNSV